ncbi:MAG TPA: nucleotide sugar dehydrogenase [Patescibacteria group bacterium]|nr:nucleotide sugar dehydrogenase [Patescibacteria group bacterium]
MSHAKQALISKINSGTARIGVVGLGYVGLPLAVAFAEAGYRVVGVDANPAKVEMLNQGKSYVEDVPDSQIAPLMQDNLLVATTDYADLEQVDSISICVPTPLSKTGDPDISYIVDATDNIAKYGGSGKLIILESTTYPGTTDEIILPRLISNGDVIGVDVFVAFSPERIDPGREDFTIHTTPKVIGGVTENCLEVAMALYGKIIDNPVPVSSTATAEMVKLLENTFRAVNIGLVNEVALMCDKLNLDAWEVVKAAATKPYGFMPFYPGPGLGGHCIPIDPIYLSWKLRSLNYTARFIELAAEINDHMPDYVVTKVTDALNEDFKAVKGSKIIILGVAYKPNISDVRESPAIGIIYLLREKGAEVEFHDPHVELLQAEEIELTSIELTTEALQQADCVLVVTHHDRIDWSFVAGHAKLIVDTRHVVEGSAAARVVYL